MRARTVSLRRRVAAGMVIDRRMLDERSMGGHIVAVPGSVNRYLRTVVFGLILTLSAWHIRWPIRG